MKRLIIAAGLLIAANTTFTYSPAIQARTTHQITRGNTVVCATVCQNTLSYCTSKRGKHGEKWNAARPPATARSLPPNRQRTGPTER